MKETPLSLCEKNSLLEKIKNGIRMDGRELMEERPFHLFFGKDFGCCTAVIGETKVLGQVTCEVVEPRPSRPNEGKLSIAIHLSPIAAPHFEFGRTNDLADELLQVLDRNIKESRCLDLESLCILAEESVWQFKVDISILNHDGNLWDACNLAAVGALRHFHRPDVTVEEDGRVTVHTPDEKELIPTFMKKVPVCLTFGFFLIDDDCFIIVDPTALEERVISGKLIVGLNPHGEITSLVFPGKVKLQKAQIMNCINRAFEKAKVIAESVMKIVEENLDQRKSIINPDGFIEMIKSHSSYSLTKINQRLEGIRAINTPIGHDYKEKIDQTLKQTNDNCEHSDEEFSSETLSLSLPEIKSRKIKNLT